MIRLTSLLALMLIVAGCGSVTPGDDSDPVGAYHFSHSRTYGKLTPPSRIAPDPSCAAVCLRNSGV
ncbi:MAG TPA: hypothetical protein VN808_07015 [Stellaceae bacterium]|nr:hypothetical protein [Stellaceae bacterium]